MTETQRHRVLRRLHQAGSAGVCVADFIHDTRPPITRVAARVAELRDHGFHITTERCDLHPHIDPDTGRRLVAWKYVLDTHLLYMPEREVKDE